MAFGNPLISNNPVDDIYATQANVQANSFVNPANYANQNPGWNIDPSLLSPSYSAMYRPQYTGNGGYNEYGHPGFFRGAYNLSPFSPEVGWGNPIMHQQAALNDVTNRPTDAAMWGFQRVAMPIAAYGMGSKLAPLLGLTWKNGARFGSGLGGGFASAFGFGSNGLRATGSAFKTAYGARGLAGIADVAGGIGFRGAIGLGSRAAAGAAFGVGLGLTAPIALAQGAIELGERGVTNPYINTRKSAENLRSNFAGITFNDSEGNAVTGRGLSFGESTSMAKQITNAGIDDMHFDTDEYRMGADMIGRTGLLDNVNKGQIVQRIKDDMKQVKMIMSIANMPEMKDAIETLAKLQMAGAGTSGGLNSTAMTAAGNLGRYASMAGTTVERLMNTVGAQGQYLYQANGMTPYLGQLAAGAAYSSFSAAQRMGVLSPEQMARMGGLEGATQASLTAQINGSQTLYNKMAMFNSYLGGQKGTSAGFGQSQDAIDVIQKFGTSMATDPLKTYGALTYYSRQMAGKQLEERGSLAIEDQVYSRIRSVAPWALKDNGKIDAETAVPFLKQMGLSDDEVQGFLAERMGETDQGTVQLRQRSLSANTAERMRQYITDNSTYGGTIGTGYYKLKKAGRSVIKSTKSLTVDPILSLTGAAGDLGQGLVDSLWYGSTISNPSDNIDAILNKNKVKGGESVFKINDSFDPFAAASDDRTDARKARQAAMDINELISKNRPGADLASNYMKTLKGGDDAARTKALYDLLQSGYLKDGFTNRYQEDFKDKKFMQLDKNLRNRKTDYTDITISDDESKRFNGELTKVDDLLIGDKDRFRAMQDIGSAVNIATRNDINEGNAEELIKTDSEFQKFAHYRHLDGKGLEAWTAAKDVAIRARAQGLDTASVIANKLNVKDYASADDALRETVKRAGGIHINATPNAKDISKDEALGLVAQTKNDALMRDDVYSKWKEGRLDFQTMRQITSQLDMGKSIDKFDKAVDKLVVHADKTSSTPAPTEKQPVTSVWTKMGLYHPGGGQKTTNGSK